jgi:recombinational DNA repair protein RecT
MEELLSVFVKCLASVMSIIVGYAVTTYLIPFLKEKKLFVWVQKAVIAAEQKYQESGKGPEKKAYVIKFLKDHFNLTLTEDELDLLIEATVKETVNAFKVTPSDLAAITEDYIKPINLEKEETKTENEAKVEEEPFVDAQTESE